MDLIIGKDGFMVQGKGKKTQEEKSREMRQRLIEATLACLQECGYHGTSISEIINRAGVSRGAWRHHYNNKRDLVAAAAEYFFTGPIHQGEALVPSLRASDRPLHALVDYIWENFYQGDYRDVWLELNVACRTDKALQERLAPVIQSFFNTLDRLWRDNFAVSENTTAPIEALMNLTLYIMRGMAIQSISIDAPDHYRELRAHWLNILSAQVHLAAGAIDGNSLHPASPRT